MGEEPSPAQNGTNVFCYVSARREPHRHACCAIADHNVEATQSRKLIGNAAVALPMGRYLLGDPRVQAFLRSHNFPPDPKVSVLPSCVAAYGAAMCCMVRNDLRAIVLPLWAQRGE